MHGLGRGGSVNDANTQWLGGGDFEIALTDFFKKGLGLAFDAVEGAACSVNALPGGGAVHVEDERELRKCATDGEGIDGANAFKRKTTRDALIDGGGVEEAVQDDKNAAFEQWADFFTNDLRAAGGEEEQLGLRSHAVAFFGVLEEMADAFTDLSAARLAQHLDFAPRTFEPILQEANLRGFATAFGTFEGEEKTYL